MWEPRKDAVRTAREARCIVNDLLGRVRPGDFVIIDCLYMLLHGGDENSAQTLQPMVMEFDRLLTEGGCSGVLLVHHQAKGASGQKAVIDRGAGSGVVSRFVDNVFSLDYLDADEEDEFVRQAGEQKLRPRRLSCVMRNAEEDESVDFLFGGPRLVTDAGGDLSRHYVSGSPQANGAHSARGNRERAEQDWAAKAELVGAALEEAAREGRVAHARVRVRLLRSPPRRARAGQEGGAGGPSATGSSLAARASRSTQRGAWSFRTSPGARGSRRRRTDERPYRGLPFVRASRPTNVRTDSL
jgi:hypothetical protein